MVRDEVLDDLLNHGMIDRERQQRIPNQRLFRALVWLLARVIDWRLVDTVFRVGKAHRIEWQVKISVYQQPVLEVVNAERGSLVETDRAEVAGDFEPALVGFVYRGAQLGAGDVHVRLEIVGALLGPVGDGAAGVIGVLQFVHLAGIGAGTFQVRGGRKNLGAGRAAGVNVTPEADVGVAVDGAGGADSGDAAREIEPRETRSMLGIERQPAAGRRIEHVIVHADKSGNHGAPGEIKHFRAVGNIVECLGGSL